MSGILEYLSPVAKPRTAYKLLLLAICTLLGVGGALALIVFCPFLLQFAYAFGGLLLLAAGALFFRLAPMLEVEYEYRIASGELEIDSIAGKRFRRNRYRAEVTDILSVLPYDEASVPEDVTVLSLCDRYHTDRYAVTVGGAKETTVLILHLPKEIYTRFCAHCPRARRR